MTPALAAAELQGAKSLAAALRVPTPVPWPPDLYEADDLERMAAVLDTPGAAGWALYYIIERDPRGLVGVAGFGGPPKIDGVVEVGYSVLVAHRRRGFASEAVAALLAHAFGDPRVTRVVAETYPSLPASIGVLVRNGFSQVSAENEDGKLRYELQRPALRD
jgi:RimJ/RimL family protein N-acetyltransferase